jgi:hypothetical protein
MTRLTPAPRSPRMSVMAGRGVYNRNSQPQHAAGDLGIDMLTRAVESLRLDGTRSIVIADYGASQGHNSLGPMQTGIDALRRRCGAQTPISVVHTDLPSNDFASLFTTLENDPQSYLRGSSDVFAFGAGRSFYEQIFPAACATLGWSSITVHWLSAVPAPVRNHIFTPFASQPERAQLARRAAEDWRRFLAHRSDELVPGGQLVIVGSGADADGRSGAEALMELANSALGQMVDEAALRGDEYEHMVIPTYYRTRREFTDALDDPSLSRALSLEECREAVLSDPLWAGYAANDDASDYATKAAAFLRAFSEPSLFGVLAAHRSQTEADELADEFYRRVRDSIERRPVDGRCAWRLILLRLVRRD